MVSDESNAFHDLSELVLEFLLVDVMPILYPSPEHLDEHWASKSFTLEVARSVFSPLLNQTLDELLRHISSKSTLEKYLRKIRLIIFPEEDLVQQNFNFKTEGKTKIWKNQKSFYKYWVFFQISLKIRKFRLKICKIFCLKQPQIKPLTKTSFFLRWTFLWPTFYVIRS